LWNDSDFARLTTPMFGVVFCVRCNEQQRAGRRRPSLRLGRGTGAERFVWCGWRHIGQRDAPAVRLHGGTSQRGRSCRRSTGSRGSYNPRAVAQDEGRGRSASRSATPRGGI
jgi:hypothetical protein